MSKRDEEIHRDIKEKFEKGFRKLGKKFSYPTTEKVETNYVELNEEITEDQGLYASELSDAELVQLRAIREAELSQMQRLAVFWCGEKGLSLAEAGKIMRIDKDTVRTHLDRARVKIREKFTEILSHEEGF